jgi:hypothetical protein
MQMVLLNRQAIQSLQQVTELESVALHANSCTTLNMEFIEVLPKCCVAILLQFPIISTSCTRKSRTVACCVESMNGLLTWTDGLCDYVKKEMEAAWKLKVPLRVDIGMGRNWGERIREFKSRVSNCDYKRSNSTLMGPSIQSIPSFDRIFRITCAEFFSQVTSELPIPDSRILSSVHAFIPIPHW